MREQSDPIEKCKKMLLDGGMDEAEIKKIDDEIKAIVEGGLTRARDVLTEHLDQLHRLAGALLEYETLTGDEIGKIIRGDKLGGDDDTPPSAIPSVQSIPRVTPPKGDPAPVPTA